MSENTPYGSSYSEPQDIALISIAFTSFSVSDYVNGTTKPDHEYSKVFMDTLSILVFYLRMEIPFYNCSDGFSIT